MDFFKGLWPKVKENWAALLIIASILAYGVDYGKNFYAQSSEFNALVLRIAQLETKVAELQIFAQQHAYYEQQLLELEKKYYALILDQANSVLNVIDVLAILDEQPISRSVLKTACWNTTIKDELKLTHGSEKVNQYCNYVTR